MSIVTATLTLIALCLWAGLVATRASLPAAMGREKGNRPSFAGGVIEKILRLRLSD
jgi:hypothetical protein